MPPLPEQPREVLAGLEEEAPVFATLDGSRRRGWRWGASAVAVGTTAWVAAVAVGGSGFGTLPALHTRVARAKPAAPPQQLQTAAIEHTLRTHSGRAVRVRDRSPATAAMYRRRRSDDDT